MSDDQRITYETISDQFIRALSAEILVDPVLWEQSRNPPAGVAPESPEASTHTTKVIVVATFRALLKYSALELQLQKELRDVLDRIWPGNEQ